MKKLMMLVVATIGLAALVAQGEEPKPMLIADYNRDGKIDMADRERAAKGEAFTIWINDDDDADGAGSGDKGDTNNDLHDVPSGKDSGGGPHHKDCADDEVNGRCDLLDFFPVLVDVQLIEGWKTLTWELRSDSANVVFTRLKADKAGDFHTANGATESYGPQLDQHAYEATVTRLVEGEVELPSEFLDEQGQGVFLVEGAALAKGGITLRGANGSGDGFEAKLDLRVNNVEDLYGWMNLRPEAEKVKDEGEGEQWKVENSSVRLRLPTSTSDFDFFDFNLQPST